MDPDRRQLFFALEMLYSGINTENSASVRVSSRLPSALVLRPDRRLPLFVRPEFLL